MCQTSADHGLMLKDDYKARGCFENDGWCCNELGLPIPRLFTSYALPRSSLMIMLCRMMVEGKRMIWANEKMEVGLEDPKCSLYVLPHFLLAYN